MTATRILLAAVMLAWAGVGQADDMVLRGLHGSTMRLVDLPCSDPQILQHLPQVHWHLLRQGLATSREHQLPACWVVQGENVLVIFGDGGMYELPISAFQRDRGA